MMFFLILLIYLKKPIKNKKMRENYTWLGKMGNYLGIHTRDKGESGEQS